MKSKRGQIMVIGYARVSTNEQSLDMQIDALTKAGCERIFSEKISGSKDVRRELAMLLLTLRSGDTLIVYKLDRLGRSLRHLLLLTQNFQQKGIIFKSLNENIDTTSPTGKLIFNIFAMLAEFERDIIRERTNAGLAAARARGRIGGRKFLLDKNKIALLKTLSQDRDLPISQIIQTLNISRPTYYNYLKRIKEESSEVLQKQSAI